MAESKTEDKVYAAAKKKVGAAIEAVDLKSADGVVQLVKLCDTLTKMKEVELKAKDGDFGSAL